MQRSIARTACAAVLSLLPLTAFGQIVTTVASGLNGPRGLKFGPDGALYVAEAGMGGSTDPCVVVATVGPYHGGPTASVTRVAPDGQQSRVVTGLPSALSSLPSGDTVGAADVAFLGNNLYVLAGGGGCSHGNPGAPAGVVWANTQKGTWSYVTDLSQFLRDHPVANPEEDDFEPDGTLFSLVTANGHLYAVEPNHGQIFRINPGGYTEQLIDLSATEGHVVPTAMVFHNGYFYVGTLYHFPIAPGSSTIYKISLDGKIVDRITGLTTVTGLAFDAKDRLYALELSDAAGYPSPGAGKIVRVNGSGQLQDILTGLVVPVGMTAGPDGALYVSNFGAAPPGLGEVLRVELTD